jgi:hypothetical protein
MLLSAPVKTFLEDWSEEKVISEFAIFESGK